MQKGFRKGTKRHANNPLILVGIIAILIALLFELYRILVPLHSANPMWREVTIGEPVINDWMYGGQDAEGYLRFFNNKGNTVLLPPGDRTFDADGKFVVIEEHTASSLTFAHPFAAIPTRWALVGMAVIALPIGMVALSLRNRPKRVSFRRSPALGTSGRARKTTPSSRFVKSGGASSSKSRFRVRAKRFRPIRKSRRIF